MDVPINTNINKHTLQLIDHAWKKGQKIDTHDIYFGPDHVEPLISHGYQEYFAFFAGLVQHLEARNIVEIGTWHGSATLAFERGLVDRETHDTKDNQTLNQLVTLDTEQRNLATLRQYPSIIPMTGNALDPRVMTRIAERFAQQTVDIFYFDDPRHLYEQSLECLGSYFMLLQPRVVIIDDIARTSAMRQLWHDLTLRWPQYAISLNSHIPNVRAQDCDLGLLDFTHLRF